MRDTKTNRIKFITTHARLKGKPITKSFLEKKGDAYIDSIINMESFNGKYKEYLTKKNFMVTAIKDGEVYEWNTYIAKDENEIVNALTNEDYSDIECAPASNHHFCKYCGSVTKDSCKDILCDGCREMFGHSLFSEL